MKFLYAGFVSRTQQNSGILKKVIGQTRGVGRLGWVARYTCLDGDNVLLNDGDGDTPLMRLEVPEGLRWRERQNAVTERICRIVREEQPDAVYLKGFLSNPYALRVAKCAKAVKPGCRVIFEIATYPYWGEYRRFFRVDFRSRDARSFAGHLLEVAQHFGTSFRMKKHVDALAVFGRPVDRLWGIPAVTIDNGVDVGGIALRKPPAGNPGSEVRLLGVAGTSIAHGYSRILEGMAAYRESKPEGEPPVRFSLVGANETIRQLMRQAEALRLQDSVEFLGYKNAAELSKLYGVCDAAVSSLGVYRIGLKYLSPLKSREYCAAGIPFLYAYEDTLPPDAPFALKIANNPSPVDIPAVVRFVEQCRGRPELPAQERRYAQEHFDWNIMMKQVLAFAGAAAKDKN